MVEYSKVHVKLSDTQLKKLKNAVKNKTGTTLRMSFKMFDENDLRPGADPDYIHLCKCWSHICCGKVI